MSRSSTRSAGRVPRINSKVATGVVRRRARGSGALPQGCQSGAVERSSVLDEIMYIGLWPGDLRARFACVTVSVPKLISDSPAFQGRKRESGATSTPTDVMSKRRRWCWKTPQIRTKKSSSL